MGVGQALKATLGPSIRGSSLDQAPLAAWDKALLRDREPYPTSLSSATTSSTLRNAEVSSAYRTYGAHVSRTCGSGCQHPGGKGAAAAEAARERGREGDDQITAVVKRMSPREGWRKGKGRRGIVDGAGGGGGFVGDRTVCVCGGCGVVRLRLSG